MERLIFLLIFTTNVVIYAQSALCDTQDTEGPPPQRAADATADPRSEEPSDNTVNAMVPPTLRTYVDAQYPAQALELGLQAEVLATLDIDAQGKVVGVKIDEPAGHGFDEAAHAAMMQFIFEPATLQGTPIACLLKYKYRFTIKTQEIVATNQIPKENAKTEQPNESLAPLESILPANLIGKVVDEEDNVINDAIIFLTGQVTGGENAESTTIDKDGVSKKDGSFHFGGLLPGMYEITIQAPGYQIYYGGEQLISGETKEITYSLIKETTQYEIVVRGRKEPRSVTRREITAAEITKIPGTDGDALRAIQNMPGTARAAMGGGDIIVRGSSHADSGFYYDNLEAPWLYHFGGLTSVINSDLLENIDFYPGNFSVHFGRATGGIIDVKTRAPKSDRFHGYVDVDLWDTSLLLEGPVSKNWSIAVSGRRSYIDAILSNIDFGEDFKMKTAPRYYDFQFIADYHPSEKNHLRLFFFGTDDKMVFIYENEENPNRGGGDNLHLMAYQGQMEWEYKFTNKLSNTLNLGAGYWGGNNGYGNYEENWSMVPILLRDEIEMKISKQHTIRTGLDMKMVWATLKMEVPGDYMIEGVPDFNNSAHDNSVFIEGKRFAVSPAIYTEYQNKMIPKTTIIAGLRTDYFGRVSKWGFDPRLSARYSLFEGTTLKAGVGLFHQEPDYAQADEDYGNPDLDLLRAVHASVGVEQKLCDNVELGVEGFYKKMDNLVTASNEPKIRDGQMDVLRFDNEGTGHVWGMEAMLKHNSTDKFFGWISYTLMKSIRKDGKGVPWRSFDHDQRHVLTAVGTYSFGRGYSLGLRFRLVSGNPYTPVSGSIYDADSDNYVPVYGKVNSRRMPLFHQLDVRFDKKWQWTHLALTAYLDVKNVYNHQNAEFPIYSDDFSEKDWITGLPILPSIGVKLEY